MTTHETEVLPRRSGEDAPWIWTKDALLARGRRNDAALTQLARITTRAAMRNPTDERVGQLNGNVVDLVRNWRAWWKGGDAIGLLTWSADASTMQSFEEQYRAAAQQVRAAGLGNPRGLESPRNPDVFEFASATKWIVLGIAAIYLLRKV